jgi:hypothetical protein
MNHLTIEHLRSFNWAGAFRGMRNSRESWDKSDSKFGYAYGKQAVEWPEIGPNDYTLCKALCVSSEERKHLRQIFVSCDVIAPWKWWKEQETYQIGTTELSTSTMVKAGKRLFTKEDFSADEWTNGMNALLYYLNQLVGVYQSYLEVEKELGPLEGEEKEQKVKVWRKILDAIPGSFIYRRTITLNYEVLTAMYKQRHNHKLVEWHEFLAQMIAGLPYPAFFTHEFETEVK